MFQRFSFSDIMAFLGFCVACAFASYVVRSIGYFSIIGPEMLWMYLESNLIQGAVVALPGVVFIVSIIVLSTTGVAYIIDYEEKYGHISRKIAIPSNLKRVIQIIAVVVGYVLVFFFDIIFGKDVYGVRMLVYFAFLAVNVVSIAEGYFSNNKLILWVSVPIGFLMLYNALAELGKWEAYRDMEKNKPRYSISADDKNYVNVTILRASSSTLILKAGQQAVFYDRSKITRVERTLD